MTTIELTQTKGPFGDECSLYSFTPKSEHLTLQDLIADARRTTGDWGYIEVSFAGTKFTLEYRHGQVISSDIPEGLYEKEITGGTAYGGWSRMDYMVEIPTPGYGGKRPGAGRPRKGEELRIPITFSVDPAIMKMAQELRKAGFPLGTHIEALIQEKYSWYFNKPFGDSD